MEEAGSLIDGFLEQSPACHWIVDAEGVFLRIYGDVSPIFGKPARDLLRHSLKEALAAPAARTWTARLQSTLEGETLLLRERRGDSAWNISMFPIRVEGEIRYAGGLASEATAWATAEQELRRTVLGALKAHDFERTVVSRFLHDSVGQNLTALGLQLDLVRMDLESLAPEVGARIVEVQKVLETMMEEVRDYSYELNPSTVERAGLRAALDRLVARVRERFTGVLRINLDPALKLDPKIAAAMYQVAQEAVENAVKHSSCSQIEIAIKSTRVGPALEVRDNGKGFDPADVRGGGRGLGLLSMEHYAAQAALDLSVTSSRGSGTVVRVAAGSPA